MNNLDQAREWAEGRRNISDSQLNAGVKAAAEVIQSLPDQWIDAEKVREALEGCDKMTYPYEVIEHIEKTLLTPPLPTLAELIEQGNDPVQYQFMQAEVVSARTWYIIGESPDQQGRWIVVTRSGRVKTRLPEHITPLPDLPRLEWPGSHADTITAESVEDVQAGCVADFERALPRPEDVPAGEPWTAKCAGFEGEWIGTRSSNPDRNYPWMLTNPQTQKREVVQDSKVTLVSRLVPEVKP